MFLSVDHFRPYPAPVSNVCFNARLDIFMIILPVFFEQNPMMTLRTTVLNILNLVMFVGNIIFFDTFWPDRCNFVI